jgi:predicted small integral membrane protein
MDTTFPDSATHWRAIPQPMRDTWPTGSSFLGEALTGAADTIGSIALLRSLRARNATFNCSKRFVYPATAFGVLVWFFALMVIEGEWFAMWQSSTWNGQQAALRCYAAVPGTGIFIALEDSDPTQPG